MDSRSAELKQQVEGRLEQVIDPETGVDVAGYVGADELNSLLREEE